MQENYPVDYLNLRFMVGIHLQLIQFHSYIIVNYRIYITLLYFYKKLWRAKSAAWDRLIPFPGMMLSPFPVRGGESDASFHTSP
jgi:hypothetical protein